MYIIVKFLHGFLVTQKTGDFERRMWVPVYVTLERFIGHVCWTLRRFLSWYCGYDFWLSATGEH